MTQPPKPPISYDKFLKMKSKPDTPKVGVGVFLERHDKILMMLRSGSHRADTWALPGGHMEIGESALSTCRRETMEELNVFIDGVSKFGFANTIFEEEGLHYITLYYRAIWDATQEPKIMEPDKIQKIKWVRPDKHPVPVFSINASDMILQLGETHRQELVQLLDEVYWERG